MVMKMKYIVVACLILAILTIGAASASQNMTCDDVAVDDGAGDAVSLANDVDAVAEDDCLGDGSEKTDVDHYVNIPDKVRVDSEYDSIDVWVYNESATGNVTVKTCNEGEDEKVLYNEYVDPTGGNLIYIKDFNLKPGVYNLSVSYTGDENLNPFTEYGTLTCYFMSTFIADELEFQSFDIYMAHDVRGTVEVFIDNVSFCNISTDDFQDDGYSMIYTVDLSKLEYGHHTYKITFDGDYELDEPFEGEFNLTYRFGVSDIYGYVYFGSDVLFDIIFPSDGEGEVVITYNGKTVVKKTVRSEDGSPEFYVALSDFALGENNITFTYRDPKYPEKSVVQTVYVKPGLKVFNQMRYANEKDAISIVLPSNATGNLVIYVKTWNETSQDYDVEIIANKSLVNGRANHTLTELGLGDKIIFVAYDGDDYKKWFDETKYYVTVVPDVIYEEYLFVNATNNITVLMPDSGNDNLTVHVRSPYYDYFDKVVYNAPANGTVTVELPKLEAGGYYLTIKYGDLLDNDYYYFEVRNSSPEWKMDIVFPSEITSEDNEIVIKSIPKNGDGHFELYIDGVKYDIEDKFIYDEEYGYWLVELDFDEYGNHTWEMKYLGDSYYRDASKNGTFFVDWIEIPQTIYDGDVIGVSLEDKEGYVELKIDGKTYGSELLDKGHASFEINGLSIANHSYEISYYDKNNVKNLTKSGSIKVDYHLFTDIDELNPYALTKEFILQVFGPDDLTRAVTVTVNGKKFTATLVEGFAAIIIDNLVLGENNVTISYPGDARYPAKELRQVINATYGIFVKYVDEEDGLLDYVSLLLPADANGNLTVYEATWIEGYYDEDEGGNIIWVPGYWDFDEDSPAMSVKLVDGFAKIPASSFTYGAYTFVASYVSALDEPDYEVDDVDFHFNVNPEVNITSDIVMGENATITVAIKNATGVVKMYVCVGNDTDGEPILELFETIHSDKGIFKKEISGLKLGEHEFYLEYEGDDMENMFSSDRSYIISVGPKKVEVPEGFNSDGSGEITFELPEGAKGSVSVYEVVGYNETTDKDILKPIIENAPYTSENKTIAISGLSTGSHELKLVYSDDKYGVFEKEANIDVPKPNAGADVVIPDTISGDELEIKLPENASGSVLVIIDGESKLVPIVNGSAKVNLSKLADGPHTVTLKYPGDGNYSGFEKSANITVKRPVDPKITASDLSILYTAGTKYTATIYGTDGKAAANTQVTFLVNGKVYKTVTTDAKGVASIAITQKPGTYKIIIRALGKEVTKTLKVKHIVKLPKVKVKRSAKKLVIKVTLAKVNGKYIKGKKVTLKFKNKKYTAKTNKKGVAKFTIKKNVLKKLKKGKKVTYQATYLKDTVKRTVKVKR